MARRIIGGTELRGTGMRQQVKSLEEILFESLMSVDTEERFKRIIRIIATQSKMLDKLINKYPGGQQKFSEDMSK